MISQLLSYRLKVLVRFIYKEYKSGEACFEDKAAMEVDLVNQIKTNKIYSGTESRYFYNIKFITTGAHPNYNVAENKRVACNSDLLDIATVRGDAIALIEPDDFNETEILNNLPAESTNDSYGCLTYPWGKYEVDGQKLVMPGAYGYLAAYSNSVATNPNWYAAAGINRGNVPGLIETLHPVSEALINTFQDSPREGNPKIYVNPIA